MQAQSKLSRYAEYRESEIDWLGPIPNAWGIVRFRYVFVESKEKNNDTPVGDMLSVSGYRGVEVKEYDDENRKRTIEELADYRVVRKGQLAVNTMWLNYAGLGVSDFDGHISPAYRSYWIGEAYHKRYIHYLVRSSVYVGGYTKYLTGIRPNSLQMGRDDLMAFPVLTPTYGEQQAIAAFLDRETAKIDTLIAKQERLVALLVEKRQHVITNALTKGLDANAKMKDSGVEWLGQIPAHWTVSRIKHLATDITKGTTPTTIGSDFTLSGVRFLKAENIAQGTVSTVPETYISEETHHMLSRSALQGGDVLVVIAGATTGKSAVLTSDLLPCNTNQAVCFVRPRTTELSNAILNWITSRAVQDAIKLTAVQSAQPNLSMEDLGNLPIAFPPRQEMKAIYAFIDSETAKIGDLIKRANRSIDLLTEHRTTLISAAVTGQIDVRMSAAEVVCGADHQDIA